MGDGGSSPTSPMRPCERFDRVHPHRTSPEASGARRPRCGRSPPAESTQALLADSRMGRSRGRSGGNSSTAAGPKRDPAHRPQDAPGDGLDLSPRKAEHVKVVLAGDVEGRYRYWNDIQVLHNALPEVDFDEV